VCFLDAGRILERGAPSRVFTAPQQNRTREFLHRVLQ
jgi:ABC-type histidine transport system ATPase subunit